ncbi:unnamed protein product [Symbiodinium necroappetens]|uniref:Uncharacterized protein n=1 Tax=Symbiodinium necroappetens TaxID=1628268 RepID=A0A813BS70_9DINO|nr:unnamed protein product [Symbiodinium necroappetens]
MRSSLRALAADRGPQCSESLDCTLRPRAGTAACYASFASRFDASGARASMGIKSNGMVAFAFGGVEPPTAPASPADRVGRGPEEGAMLAELESSFLSPLDPETETRDARLQLFDISSSTHNFGNESALMAIVQEMRRGLFAEFFAEFARAGGETYTHRNVGFGLWWALPYLYITSGMSSMMSKSSLWGYVIRLVVVFTAGVSANLFADLVKHRDWRHDFGNTIFQMFFVIMLLIMAPLAEPLRQALRSRQEGQSVSRATVAFTVFWGAVSAVALASFVRGYTGDSPDFVTQTFEDEEVSRWIKLYAPILRHTPIILVHVAGTLFLGLLATILCQPENTGLVGWVLLAFTYLQMVIVPWDQDSFAHLVNLNIAGMLTFQWPLAGSKHIAAAVKAYWPFLLMFLCLDSMPDMWGRCDVHSPYSTWERFRMFLGELILVVCFMAGAFTPSDPHRITSWLGQWSLYAYCFHVMWYRLLGSPYGAIVTFAGMPLFWAMAACVPQKANAK